MPCLIRWPIARLAESFDLLLLVPQEALPANAVSGTKVGNRLAGIVIDEEAMRCAKQEAGFARVEVESAVTAGFEKRNLSSKGAIGGQSASAGLFSVRGAVSVISSTNFFTASPMGVRDGLDYMYAGVVRSVNVELLQRQLQEGAIVSMTPLGSSPGGEVFYVSSEELAAKVASRLQAIKLVYITKGQCLVDTRQSRIIAGMQAHDARNLLQYLESDKANQNYSEEERRSDWFSNFVRSLRLLVASVSPKGVRRGHLVQAFPGSLLQEFYTTDGSGTCVAQDVYQGLGCATLADATSIMELLADAQDEHLKLEQVEASCASGEFFVWRRDEVVLGCGQLVAHSVSQNAGELVAELRQLCCAAGTFLPNAPALFAYAERAAVLGGAQLLVVLESEDPERNAWFAERGFVSPSSNDKAKSLPPSLQSPRVYIKRLGEDSGEEAEAAIAAYAEEQRMWGGMV
ncbi:unnamed protein product [Durusdinium trenchii]|uniref:Aspartate/glutamate/uridylate kinase domain-containing protein n=1 Tax=Durusdinium trenchii TaxID=1381693 RepID=A0ABP0KFJ4_9DINO